MEPIIEGPLIHAPTMSMTNPCPTMSMTNPCPAIWMTKDATHRTAIVMVPSSDCGGAFIKSSDDYT